MSWLRGGKPGGNPNKEVVQKCGRCGVEVESLPEDKKQAMDVHVGLQHPGRDR